MYSEVDPIICPLCLEREGHIGECFACKGHGFKRASDKEVPCNRCNGTGKSVHPCKSCLEFGEPLQRDLKCHYCYIDYKKRRSFRVEGTDAKEVENVAISLLREERLLEAQNIITEARVMEINTFRKNMYENNSDRILDFPEIRPLELFISYTHRDKPILNKLKEHLEPLRKKGIIQIWCDQEIKAGSYREKEIDEHLNTAQIIIFLLSAAFISSDYCTGNEVQRALERHDRGETHVIPVIARPVLWELVLIPIHKLHILPKNGKPITDPFWVSQDRAFHEVAKGIYDIVEQIIKKNIS